MSVSLFSISKSDHLLQGGTTDQSDWIVCLHRKVFIDFDKLQTQNSALKVQRLSFVPQGQTEDVGWYYRDDQLWREYGSQVRRIFGTKPPGPFDVLGVEPWPNFTQIAPQPFFSIPHLFPPLLQGSSMLASSVSSRDVESQFALNPQGRFNFTVGTTGYTLDFSSMWYFDLPVWAS